MGLTPGDLDAPWVQRLASQLHGGHDVNIESFALTPLLDNQGVLSRYEQPRDREIVGHRLLTLRGAAGGQPFERRVVIKAKIVGARLRQRVAEAYLRFDPSLVDLQLAVTPSILDDVHVRELAIYALEEPALRAITPAIYQLWRDDDRQLFAIVMEHLDGVRHANTLADLDVWTPADLTCVLEQLAGLHGALLGKLSGVAPPPWLVPFPALHGPTMQRYQAALLRYNADTFPELFTPARRRILESFLASADARHRELMTRPLTLIHGDFTPRNACLRHRPDGELALCVYDWELAQAHLPPRDIFEFLCYTLPPPASWRGDAVTALLQRYRRALVGAARQDLPTEAFERDLAISIKEFCTFKLLVQGITHQLLGNRTYFERLVHNAFAGIAAFAADPE